MIIIITIRTNIALWRTNVILNKKRNKRRKKLL